jgi:hypothetical protein
MHVQRLAESAQAMAEAEGGGAAATTTLQLPPLPALRAAAERVMARAVRRVTRRRQGDEPEKQEEEEEEVKLTLLLTWPPRRWEGDDADSAATAAANATDACRLACHAQALPRPPRPPVVRAVACGRPRANARAKDSAWVRERRAAVELAKRAAAAFDDGGGGGRGDAAAAAAATTAPIPVEETLLVGPEGALEEGASSNFFALTRDGVLQTAGEDVVLPGTVRAVVLSVARRGLGGGGQAAASGCWPVSRVDEGRAPRLGEAAAGSWRACFVSSTSRQLLPVEEVLDATEAAAVEAAAAAAGEAGSGAGAVPVPRVAFRTQGDDPGVAALVEAVRVAILEDSEPLPTVL